MVPIDTTGDAELLRPEVYERHLRIVDFLLELRMDILVHLVANQPASIGISGINVVSSKQVWEPILDGNTLTLPQASQ